MPDPVDTPKEPVGTELTARDPELDRYARLGKWMAMAERPGNDLTAQGAAAALKLYFAKELGLPPWASSQILFQRGQLGGTVELKRALANRAGYDVKKVKETAESCTAVVVERASGKEKGRATFTMAQAKKAGLVRPNSAWETYPERMLWARAAGWAMKDAIPEVVVGLTGEDDADERVPAKPGTDGNAHEPVDLIVHDEYLAQAQAEAEEAEFAPIPPGPLDEETQTALDDLDAEEVTPNPPGNPG